MYNNEDLMSKLNDLSKDLLEDINVLSNQVSKLRDEKNLKPELYVVDEEDLTLETYRLVDFIDFFNDQEFKKVNRTVSRLKKLQLFLDKDNAIEYLKDLEIKQRVKECLEIGNEI